MSDDEPEETARIHNILDRLIGGPADRANFDWFARAMYSPAPTDVKREAYAQIVGPGTEGTQNRFCNLYWAHGGRLRNFLVWRHPRDRQYFNWKSDAPAICAGIALVKQYWPAMHGLYARACFGDVSLRKLAHWCLNSNEHFCHIMGLRSLLTLGEAEDDEFTQQLWPTLTDPELQRTWALLFAQSGRTTGMEILIDAANEFRNYVFEVPYAERSPPAVNAAESNGATSLMGLAGLGYGPAIDDVQNRLAQDPAFWRTWVTGPANIDSNVPNWLADAQGWLESRRNVTPKPNPPIRQLMDECE